MLAEDISNVGIGGPDADEDAAAPAREPVADDAEVDGPGEGLHGPVECLHKEKVGCVLLALVHVLEAAEAEFSHGNQRVHEADQLTLAVDVAQMREEEASE